MKKILAIILAVLMLTAMAACGGAGEEVVSNTDDTSVPTIDITVWCAENLVDLTTAQLDAYAQENTDAKFNFVVEPVSESEAATNMLTDVEAGADIFCFAQDQIARLVSAGALSPVSDALIKTVTSENDGGSVGAATVGGTVYAFPLTSDNGFFAYYDNTVLTAEDMLNQTTIIEACKAAGKTVAMNIGSNGSVWYSAGYFFGAGCVSEWTTDDEGNFTSYDDTFNSAKGLIATKGMAELINSGAFVDTATAADALAADSAVVVTGTWDYETAKSILGDNLSCCKLWSYTVDGKDYQLGSFSGNKLVGIKPQADSIKAAYCQSIAAYLTNAACQLERFDTLSWGPSNLEAQSSDAVKANPGLVAFNEQNAFAIAQGQYPNSWWDAGKAIGASIFDLGNTAPSDEELQAILNTYTDSLNSIISNTFSKGWVVVGDLDLSWDILGGDTAGNGTGKYVLRDADGPVWELDIEIAAADWDTGFRICRYNEWTGGDYHANGIGFSFLTDGSVGTEGGDNNVLLEAGTYHVKFDLSGDAPALTVTAA